MLLPKLATGIVYDVRVLAWLGWACGLESTSGVLYLVTTKCEAEASFTWLHCNAICENLAQLVAGSILWTTKSKFES